MLKSHDHKGKDNIDTRSRVEYYTCNLKMSAKKQISLVIICNRRMMATFYNNHQRK